METAQEILDRAVSAHGGAEHWGSLRAMHVDISIGGLALGLKGSSMLSERVQARIDPHRVDVRLESGRGNFHLRGRRIRQLDENGIELRAKELTEEASGRTRTPWIWGPLDRAFFIGYALWNYALTPWLLSRQDMAVERIEDARLHGAVHQRLRVTFPPGIPTHCPRQDFWFAEDGRLARLDYVAYPLSFWARGAHEVQAVTHFDGVPVPSRRRVFLRPFGRLALRGIPVVAGEVHNVRWETATGALAHDGSRR